MSNIPVVKSSWAQGGKEEAAAKVKFAKEAAEKSYPEANFLASQQIGFFGHTNTGENRVVLVLAGEGAPIVTGGWTKVVNIPRFQRVAYTVPEGWEPITMSVPIQFEALKKVQPRKDLLADIGNLEWMAGRYPTTKEIKGEPPYVEVYVVNNAGVQVPLIPQQYQGEPGRSQQWFITNIAFDSNALRDEGGGVLRQKATVTLTEIISPPSVVQKNREAREAVKNKYKVVKSTKATNTIKKIAKEEHIPNSWKAISEANKNISGEKELSPGTKIKIPETAFRQVPK